MVSRETTLEALLRGDERNSSKFSDSAFELGGLTQRTYDLVALDTKSLRTTVLRNVPAGSRGVIMELPGDESLRRVAGRVVSHSGVGVAGVSLHFGRVLESEQYANIARSAETDEQGRFDLGRVDPTDLRVQVIGEATFLIMQWQPPQGAALDDLKIVVSQRCSVRVELSSTNQAADAFAFLDASGAPTQNLRFEGAMLTTPLRCPIVGGRSEVFATEDSARTLLLFQDGQELARVPVQLDPAKLVVLRP
jgi:hypothetical protein